MAERSEALSSTSTGKASEISNDKGKTAISDQVVAKIAGIAAGETEGVHELLPRGVGKAISTLAQRVTWGDLRGKSVNVEVGTREAAIDLKLVLHYGVNIPKVAQAVRENVIDAIRSMTGLVVKEVNIDVADLYFPEDDKGDKNRPRVE